MSTNEILAAIWQRKLTFVATFLALLAVVVAVTFSLPKVYQATATLYVGNAAVDKAATLDTNIGEQLARTYTTLAANPNVADDVRASLPGHPSRSALLTNMSFAPVERTRLLLITAQAESPARARLIANTYAQVFVNRVGREFRLGTTQTQLAVNEVAAAPVTPSKPNPPLYIGFGVLLAALLAFVVALLRHRLDQRLEVDASSSELLGLPVLARIPRGATPAVSRLPLAVGGAKKDRDGALGEAFRLLLANLAFVSVGERPTSLAVVSAGEKEGKSTVSINLASAAAELGSQVLLVDADLRRPTLRDRVELAGTPTSPGLSGFLASMTPWAIAEVAVEVTDRSVQLVPSGPVPPNPSALLSSKALADFDRRTRRAFDLVIYDTPPVTVAADASLVAAQVEGVILVVDAQSTRRSAALQAIEQLQRAQGRILGVVINRAPESPDNSYYGEREPDAKSIAAQNGRPALEAEQPVS